MIIFIGLEYGSKITGWFGEHWVKEALGKLDKNVYNVLIDVMLVVDGKSCQIDHSVVSKYGVFVIETKQFNGYITGSKYDKKWVRHVGKKKYYYTNPIRQNYGHVKSLAEFLNMDESKIYNVVCMTGTDKLKIEHSPNHYKSFEKMPQSE